MSAVPELPLETLVRAVPGVGVPSGPAGRVVDLTLRPVSVAEISAGLGVPLGEAQALVADLAAAGLLEITPPAAPGRPDPEVLGRLLEGLRSRNPGSSQI